MRKRPLLLLVLVLLLGGSAVAGWLGYEAAPLTPAPPPAVADALEAAPAVPAPAMAPGVSARVDSLIRAGIEARAFPGAAIAIGREAEVLKLKGYGRHTYAGGPAVTATSLFDIASLTKVVATTAAAMRLHEEGRLDLDAPVARYLPGFEQNGKGAIRVRDLLAHTSGVRRAFFVEGLRDADAILEAIYEARPRTPPGTAARYSDYNFITLALVVEAVTERPFAAYVEAAVFGPLGMTATGFRAVGAPDSTVVPTEVDRHFRRRLVQGEVHDEIAWILGGVAGHAGLFSTAADLARFAAVMANGGTLGGERFFEPETVRLFTSAVAPGVHSRALGWDTKSPEGYSSAGERFGPRAFGHTGFTGTSLWVDPDVGLWVVLLTNRVYPSRAARGHRHIRARLADLAYEVVAPPIEPVRVEE